MLPNIVSDTKDRKRENESTGNKTLYIKSYKIDVCKLLQTIIER